MTLPEFIIEIRWPLVVLIFLLASGNRIWDFISKYGHVELTAKPMKLILNRLEKEYDVSNTQIKKLQGLTGHDLWVLAAFIKQPDDSFKYIKKFNPQRKAIIYSFNEMGLVEILGEGDNRYVKPTKLASEVIEAANKLL